MNCDIDGMALFGSRANIKTEQIVDDEQFKKLTDDIKIVYMGPDDLFDTLKHEQINEYHSPKRNISTGKDCSDICESGIKIEEMQYEQLVNESLNVLPESKMYECYICKHSDAVTVARLKQHMRSHSAVNTNVNKLCPKKLVVKIKKISVEMFNRAFATAKNEVPKMYECYVCGRFLQRKNNLRRHLEKHLTKAPPRLKSFKCTVCLKKFSTKFRLICHQRSHSGEKPFECVYCSKTFAWPATLGVHMKLHSGDKPFYCEYCPKKFKLRTMLKIHQKKHSAETPYSCDHCSKAFPRKRALTVHQWRHAPEKKYACCDCSMKFIAKSDLRNHRRKHWNAGNEYKCSECQKGFKYKASLHEHTMRVHAGEKRRSRYACDICLQTFVKKSGLIRHMTIHSGEKPHSCKECAMKFRQKYQLHEHQRIHTDEKPFTCEFCLHSFRQKSTLKTHTRMHTGERPFACTICPKTFPRRSFLNDHLASTHSGGEKRHACTDCTKKFSTRTLLTVHRKNTHLKNAYKNLKANVKER